MRGPTVLAALLSLASGCNHPPPAARPVAAELPAACPQGTRWNGEHCLWQHILTKVSCPEGSAWDGRACRGTTVECGRYSRWDGQSCSPAPALAAKPPNSVYPAEARREMRDHSPPARKPAHDGMQQDRQLRGRSPEGTEPNIFDGR